jgi:hypothetical protein
VEQIGTDSDWINGKPSYYAWYEMYPSYPVNLPNPVAPGDSITGEVSYVGTNFVLTLTDKHATAGGWSFSITQQLSSAQRSSAEWIVEAPSSGGRVLPLADFGTVNFSAASATINGHTGKINDSTWQNDAITMVTSRGVIKAQPSGLSTDGSSFSVTWFHN